jgi:hypothetical protein
MALSLQAMMSLDTVQFTAPLKAAQAQLAMVQKQIAMPVTAASVIAGQLPATITASSAIVAAQNAEMTAIRQKIAANMAARESYIMAAAAGATSFGVVAAGAKESGSSLAGVNTQTKVLIQTLMSLSAVGSGSLRGLMSGMRGLSMLFGELGMGIAIIGAGLYGWSKLMDKVASWTITPIEDSFKRIADACRATRHELERMDRVRMDKLKDTLKGIGDIMAPYIQQFERETNRKTSVSAAQSEARQAEINATYLEGPEKERALAAEEYTAAIEKAKAEENLAKDSIQAAKEQQAHAEFELNRLREQVRTAEPGWQKASAEERLQAARPKIEAIIDAATEQIADSTARLAVLAANRKAAEWNSLGKQAKANEMENPPETKEVSIQRTNLEIASDRLSKIGLYVGGGSMDLWKRTAAATERMAKSLDKYLPKLVPAGGTTATWEA